MMKNNYFKQLLNIAIILALLVVTLGAYTRLTNAGLGCPDWPGCYGKLIVSELQSPMDNLKAWTEMIHRYAAATLGLLVFIIALISFFTNKPKKAPILLVLLVVFQALLGMWTVTLKLLPLVVMGHLLGGTLIFSILVYYRIHLPEAYINTMPSPRRRRSIHNENSLHPSLTKYRFWIGLGALIVFLQIALGGWVSSNYAGIACIGFPTCNGMWLPSLNLLEGFNVLRPIGINYQGGILDSEARIAIQLAHRIGAVITAVYILSLATVLLARIKNSLVTRLSVGMIVLVCLQFSLGIINVTYLLPLWSAVAHNAVAILLFANCLSLIYFTKKSSLYAIKP